jgi:hypothetical protein
MERVSVARMATAKLQGWIHAARGMGVSGFASTELNSYKILIDQKRSFHVGIYAQSDLDSQPGRNL